MSGWQTILLLVVGISILFYHRASISVGTMGVAFLLLLVSKFSYLSIPTLGILWIIFALIAIVMNLKFLRLRFVTKPFFKKIRHFMPALSDTERAALDAGTVGWEGELFRGKPDWSRFNRLPAPKISDEEQAFLDGPLNKLCSMIDDWQITHDLFDMPPEVWKYIKDEGFLGLIIPKEYGGKEFSAVAHAQIISRLAGCSVTVASIVSVPNSLGPAELLLEYGTEEQKKHYLPRLASGKDIPCFALTGPESGSDASNMPDNGVICKGEFNGKEIIGIKLNWNKRYITLAPIATVLGLAFRLYDPDHLMGDNDELGITCALIPTKTKGVVTGRRHMPLNAAFPNGPTQGKDVFIPLDWIIGGFEQAGQGWKMLVERLAVGRAISLPSISGGGALAATAATGAYARIREQFGLPIGKFGGIQEALARMGGYSYIIDACRLFSITAIDNGEEPAVPSAMAKYHVTEMGRKVVTDAMDIHGGKGICLGPNNYLGRGYQANPIGITVEGANILTRSMIIFGQGAVRCHPYVLDEIEAVLDTDEKRGLARFDKAIWGHVGHFAGNFVRTFWLNITVGYFSKTPKKFKTYYRKINRMSASFAFLVDLTMAALGNRLKRMEKISARLGDIHSMLYLTTAVLKHYNNQKQHKHDEPFVHWSCQLLLYDAQQQMDGLLRNFPLKWMRWPFRIILFPWGLRWQKPKDSVVATIAHELMTPSRVRKRLLQNVYLADTKNNLNGRLETVLQGMIDTQDLRTKLHHAARKGKISGVTLTEQIASAAETAFITKAQAKTLNELDAMRREIIAVDDFDVADATK